MKTQSKYTRSRKKKSHKSSTRKNYLRTMSQSHNRSNLRLNLSTMSQQGGVSQQLPTFKTMPMDVFLFKSLFIKNRVCLMRRRLGEIFRSSSVIGLPYKEIGIQDLRIIYLNGQKIFLLKKERAINSPKLKKNFGWTKM